MNQNQSAQDIKQILQNMSIKEKMLLLDKLSREENDPKPPAVVMPSKNTTVPARKETEGLSLLSFAEGRGRSEAEIKDFNLAREALIKQGLYSMEVMRTHATRTTVEIVRQTREKYQVVNFANYNYLGYATHAKVIEAAKNALDKYGLGATASPIASGMLDLHRKFEDALVKFFGLEGYGVTLFSSGYGALVGTISAYIHKSDHLVLDSNSHASIVEGAMLSQGTIHQFYHNDMDELEEILKEIDNGENRILICTEGVYSADGDFGDLKNIVRLARKYGARVLVDEAHSMLVTGTKGRGACEMFGVLGEVDMIIGTFSKGFSGIGGFLFAKKDLTNYVNFFARNRMFSCALDPAVTAGMMASLKLAQGPDGDKKRKRLIDNSNYFRELLKGKVNMGESSTWVVPVIFGGPDNITLNIADFLQKEGFEGSMMSYPAVPRNKARIRVFISSEHSKEELKKGAEVILKAAEKFNFLIK